MEGTIEYYKKSVDVIFGKLEFYKKQIKINQEVYSINEVNSILFRIRSDYEKFEDVQNKFEILDGSDKSESHGNVRGHFEHEYLTVESSLLRLKSKLENKFVKNDLASTSQDAKANSFLYPLSSVPTIDLPKFDGRFESWINFRLIYSELIHENESMSSLLKFQYLRNSLMGGSAEHFIDGVSASVENYETVWKALYNQYENDTRLKFHHMGELYNLQPIKQTGNLSREIQLFVAKFWKHYNTLKSINVPIEHWDLYLVHHVSQLVDQESLRQIELKRATDTVPKIQEVMDILSERARLLETLSQKRTVGKAETRTFPNSKPVKVEYKKTHIMVASDNSSNLVCIYCKSNHLIFSCDKFRSLEWSAKNDFVIQNKLCRKCFGNHYKNNCKAKNCKVCSYPHHTLLHAKRNLGDTPQKQISQSTSEATDKLSSTSQSHMVVCNDESVKIPHASSCLFSRHSQVILPTAVVWINDSFGNRVPCRALIDCGAQSNFITEKMCQLLKLRRKTLTWNVSGIGDNKCVSQYCINTIVSSRLSDYSRMVECLVLPVITGPLPNHSLKITDLKLPNIELGDPLFYESKTIDLLLGAEIYAEIILGNKIEICKDLPPFINSEFGYIVCGKIGHGTSKVVNNSKSFTCCDVDQLNKSIQKFWHVENVTTQNNFSLDEKSCERHYVDNVVRDETGRFVVGLPFKSNIVDLGESKNNALRQFYNLERRLMKDPELHRRYSEFMTEYISLNHMSPLNFNFNESSEFVLPHHPVFKESSTTTKLRVVFNASSPSSTGLSLNDVLLTGPTIQRDLLSLVLNFRFYIIALTADITKMYRQVVVRENDRKYQQIFWREKIEDPVMLYQLNTVTYGTASAPFLAIRSLKQLAAEEYDKYPLAATTLLNNFYVDDLLAGAANISDAHKLKTDLMSLLALGGFELRKWVSNDKSLIPDDVNEPNNVVTTLGLIWNSKNDTFQLPSNNFDHNIVVTKRSVLTHIAKFFDPLGLAGPVIFRAKLFMQRLWAIPNLAWDDVLMEPFISEWCTFANELEILERTHVPRCVLPGADVEKIELHGFGDASELGYGACMYVRSWNGEKWNCMLLCAKSRVAPLKKLTIPRLELAAALMLAQLYEKVRESLSLKISSVKLYSDSTITLHRIHSSPSRYATFVANRVSQIQDIAQPQLWSYIPSEINPADVLSRGVLPSELESNDLWWHGPNFLIENDNSNDFLNESYILDDDPEILKRELTHTTIIENNTKIYEECDSYDEALRMYAYCKRYLKNINCHKLSNNNCHKFEELSVDELESALKCIIKNVQQNCFVDELKSLKAEKNVKLKKLAKLNPFIDSDGLIRVGGRLGNSNLNFDQCHPYLLPNDNYFSKLIVKHLHFKNLHVGTNALMSYVRQKFWIMGLRQLCKNVVHTCLRCYRMKPKNIQQLMGQLPAERLESFKVFENVGIDFCGPFLLSTRIRSKVALKSYVCLFICFSTKACHLEVVDNLSTQSFLLALKRFIGRRSTCSNIYSDNATNFIGAKNELKELNELFNNELHKNEVLKFCVSNGINWKTIPARSPHFGGLWEAGIKSAKHLLTRQLGTYQPNLEEFRTLIVQVECCLNSRPLTPLSEDPSDISVLTPGHFLVGKPLNALPEPSLVDLNFNRLSHYQKITQMLQQFWLRWSREYLSGLQERNKWLNPEENVKLGNLVLLKEDNVPPLKWIMGRVIEVHPGSDGLIRVVVVKTATNIFKRAITRICVLPSDTRQD